MTDRLKNAAMFVTVWGCRALIAAVYILMILFFITLMVLAAMAVFGFWKGLLL